MDTSLELDLDAASYYLTVIGILRWTIELEIINTISKVSLLLSCVGNLDAAVHVMAHVGQRCNYKLVYDTSYTEIDPSLFKKCDWSEFCRDSKEAIPKNAPDS